MAIKNKDGYYKVNSVKKDFYNNFIEAEFSIYSSEEDRLREKNRPKEYYNFIKSLSEKERQLTKELEDSVSLRHDIKKLTEKDIDAVLTQEEKAKFNYIEKLRKDLRKITRALYSETDKKLNFLDEYIADGFKEEWLTPAIVCGNIGITMPFDTKLELTDIYNEAKKNFKDYEDC